MISFLTHHVDFQKKAAQDRAAGLINLHFQSARIYHPNAPMYVLTDKHTPFSDLSPQIRIKRYDIAWQEQLLNRWDARVQYLREFDFASHLVVTDYDILFHASLENLFRQDFDIALTYRKDSELAPQRRHMPINGGVLLIKKFSREKSLPLMEKFYQEYRSKHADEPWWGEQQVMANLIGLENIPKNGQKTVEVAGVKFLLLPCETYNFSPDNNYRAIRKEIKNKPIIHFKGKRIRLMKMYWNLYLSPFATTARFQLLGELLREWFIPEKISTALSYTKKSFQKSIKKTSKKLAKRYQAIRSPSKYRHNDSILRNLITDRTVYILGSGPSASELESIPDNAIVMTCNAGLRYFLDEKRKRKVDVYFFIRSKLDKIIDVDGKAVGKVRYMESLLQKVPTQILLTNHPKHILETKSLLGTYLKLLYDDPQDPHYLKPLISPHQPSEIAGSAPCAWTSTGIRLLQYALFFDAKEIYLAGMDFGKKGYFWGNNPNEWRHIDIDENFIRIIAKKYEHVFSACPSSPLSDLLPIRSPQRNVTRETLQKTSPSL